MASFLMSQKLRSLYLAVWNGVNPVHTITSPLHYLECMFPREKLEPALRYLIRSGITGNQFTDWYFTKCKGSNLEMHRELVRAVDRDRYMRRLTAQKDLRT